MNIISDKVSVQYALPLASVGLGAAECVGAGFGGTAGLDGCECDCCDHVLHSLVRHAQWKEVILPPRVILVRRHAFPFRISL